MKLRHRPRTQNSADVYTAFLVYAKPSARVRRVLATSGIFVAFRGHGFNASRLLLSSLLLVFPVYFELRQYYAPQESETHGYALLGTICQYAALLGSTLLEYSAAARLPLE